MRSRGRESQVLDGYEVMWREATGKVVFSRRLERAIRLHFWDQKQKSRNLGLHGSGVTVFLEGRNSRRLIPLRRKFSGCLLGGVFSEPGDF